jgi:FlaA1/EpsC-like NDP-sugar epimerase
MENYPDEAVKTNIIGTYYTSLASIQAGVRDFIFVSTDKAVNPTSVMGATKRAAEKIVLSLNKMQNVTNFRLTRFGNVLGSRGSVLPVFARQIEKGEKITVTHPDITRYFMSISEAARLVIKAATEPQGKIFVMDMGRPIRILDLAKSLLSIYGYSESNFHIEFSGLRKGEKMHEELSYSREKLKPSAYEKLFLSQEDFTPLSREEIIAMVTELAEAAEKNNRAGIYSKLGKFVHEFKYDEQEV